MTSYFFLVRQCLSNVRNRLRYASKTSVFPAFTFAFIPDRNRLTCLGVQYLWRRIASSFSLVFIIIWSFEVEARLSVDLDPVPGPGLKVLSVESYESFLSRMLWATICGSLCKRYMPGRLYRNGSWGRGICPLSRPITYSVGRMIIACLLCNRSLCLRALVLLVNPWLHVAHVQLLSRNVSIFLILYYGTCLYNCCHTVS